MASGHASPESVVGTVLTMTILASVFVGMRLYARLGLGSRTAGLDDLCISLSMLFSIATATTMIVQAGTGMGRHSKDVELHELHTNLQAFWVSTWVYNLSLTFTKVSILFQYLRIFPGKTFRIATWTLMGIIVGYGIYVLCTGIWLCRPIAFFWDATIEGGKCLDRFTIWFVNAGLNIATDVATTVLPLPILNKLELPRKQKRALMFVFALGGFTCIISVLRLQSLYIIANTDDPSWHNPLAAIWSNVEMNTAVIASCLPTIRCLFPKLLKATSLSASLQMRSGDEGLRGGTGGWSGTTFGGGCSNGGGKSGSINASKARASMLNRRSMMPGGGGGGGAGAGGGASDPYHNMMRSNNSEQYNNNSKSPLEDLTSVDLEGKPLVSRPTTRQSCASFSNFPEPPPFHPLASRRNYYNHHHHNTFSIGDADDEDDRDVYDDVELRDIKIPSYPSPSSPLATTSPTSPYSPTSPTTSTATGAASPTASNARPDSASSAAPAGKIHVLTSIEQVTHHVRMGNGGNSSNGSTASAATAASSSVGSSTTAKDEEFGSGGSEAEKRPGEGF